MEEAAARGQRDGVEVDLHQLELRHRDLRILVGPREIAVHDKAISTTKQRKTLPAHRPPRGQPAVHVPPALECPCRCRCRLQISR
jgi:hypothetical protein